jgi:hypothetical protein
MFSIPDAADGSRTLRSVVDFEREREDLRDGLRRTATSHIPAATRTSGNPRLLDEAIIGTGVATVFVSPQGENLYPRCITYVFTPVPEPRTWPLAVLSLAAMGI